MNGQIESYAVEILGVLLTLGLGALYRLLLAHLSAQQRAGLPGTLATAAYRVVLRYEQTVVGDLKAKAASGAITQDFLRQELARVKTLALGDLRHLAEQLFGEEGAPSDLTLETFLEAAVGELRGAGALAFGAAPLAPVVPPAPAAPLQLAPTPAPAPSSAPAAGAQPAPTPAPEPAPAAEVPHA